MGHEFDAYYKFKGTNLGNVYTINTRVYK